MLLLLADEDNIDLEGDLESVVKSSLSESSLTLSLDMRLPRLRFLTHPKIEVRLVGDSEWDMGKIMIKERRKLNFMVVFPLFCFWRLDEFGGREKTRPRREEGED